MTNRIPTSPDALSKLMDFFDDAIEKFETTPVRDPLAPPPIQVYDIDSCVDANGLAAFSCNICERQWTEQLDIPECVDKEYELDGLLPQIADEHGCYRDQS